MSSSDETTKRYTWRERLNNAGCLTMIATGTFTAVKMLKHEGPEPKVPVDVSLIPQHRWAYRTAYRVSYLAAYHATRGTMQAAGIVGCVYMALLGKDWLV